jgi:hypothetical protein
LRGATSCSTDVAGTEKSEGGGWGIVGFVKPIGEKGDKADVCGEDAGTNAANAKRGGQRVDIVEKI